MANRHEPTGSNKQTSSRSTSSARSSYDGKLRLASKQAQPSSRTSSAATQGPSRKTTQRQSQQDAQASQKTQAASSRTATSRAKDTNKTQARSTVRQHAKKPAQKTQKKPRAMGGLKRLGIALLLVVAIAAAGAFAYVNHLNTLISDGIDEGLSSVLSAKSDVSEPFYMLLLGVDRSEGREAKGQDTFRTDTIIVARIDASKQKVTLISVHRDLLVDLGEYGEQKINAAYAYGGAALTVSTVEDVLGIDISHYAEMDFEGLEAVVDELGGIEVDLATDISDPDHTGLDLKAGVQTVDGETALDICRARHAYDSYGDGDTYRAANQRMVIAAILKKILSSDVASITSTVTTLAEYTTCDLSVSSLASLATQFAGIDVSSDVYSGSDPTESEYIDGTWYEILDEDAWKTMRARIEAGLSPYASEDENPTAGVAGVTLTEGDIEALDHVGEVCVINATGVAGMATQTAEELEDEGYIAYASSLVPDTQDETVVYFNGKDRRALAKALATDLGLAVTSVSSNQGDYSAYPGIVVVLGTDQIPDYYGTEDDALAGAFAADATW